MGALGKSDASRGDGEPRSPSIAHIRCLSSHPGVIVAESVQEGGVL